jgi:zinc transport system substrate-binding protein
MKRIRKYIIVLLGLLFIMAACSSLDTRNEGEENEKSTDQIQVVASIFPVYEITEAIAGDKADISLMVGANEDAHHYEPSAQAIAAVNEADIFIYSSHVMEFWVDSLLEVVENDDLKIIEMADGLNLSLGAAQTPETEEHGHAHDHGGEDPHFWLDPVAVNHQIPIITDALSQADPENAQAYEENAADFGEELLKVHEAYEQAFKDAENNIFVVQHQAFGHLAHRYNLEQVAVGGLTTEIEPSPQKMVEIIDFVNAQDVPVIYYQSGESSAVAETIANETHTEIAVLYDLEGEPIGLNETENRYLEAMYKNLEQLKYSIQ